MNRISRILGTILLVVCVISCICVVALIPVMTYIVDTYGELSAQDRLMDDIYTWNLYVMVGSMALIIIIRIVFGDDFFM